MKSKQSLPVSSEGMWTFGSGLGKAAKFHFSDFVGLPGKTQWGTSQGRTISHPAWPSLVLWLGGGGLTILGFDFLIHKISTDIRVKHICKKFHEDF